VAFHKHYPNRKDWLGRYYGSQRFDTSCRPHGGCPYCESGRRVRADRQRADAKDQMRELALQANSVEAPR
jgi:hypothetical protein